MEHEIKHKRYAYCIFYLERKYYKRINQDLKDKGYHKIHSIVPTVKILRKTHKGKSLYSEEPLLFNYGFIRIPYKLAYSRDFLNKLKRNIPGIRGWLKDTQTLFKRKKKKKIDNLEDWDDFSMIAQVTRKKLHNFIRLSKENKKYSLDDITNLKIGDYVTLKGYPYEGMGATIHKVDYKNKVVVVEIMVINGYMKVSLPFDNVLYSVYQNYDPDKCNGYDESFRKDITQEEAQNIVNRKQY